MRCWITRPDGPGSPVEEALLDWWRTNRGPNDSIRDLKAFPGQCHESFLTELWHRTLREFHHNPKYLFADMDFILDSGALASVSEILDTHKAVFVPYFTRDIHGVTKHPHFTGLWFWAVRLEVGDTQRLPPQHWLHTIGRPLDVGCGGLYHLLQSGFCRADQIAFIDGRGATAPERTGWVEYPGLGAHVFNHRNFHQPDYLLEPFGIKIAKHVENIQAHLAALRATLEQRPRPSLPAEHSHPPP